MSPPPRTLLIDYGSGNLHSAAKALAAVGLEPEVSADPDRARNADLLVLPGQGHFGQVAGAFAASGFTEPVLAHLAAGKPFLGICVGLQLLFESSEEAPDVPGLGLLPGRVRRFPASALPVPHMGWNTLEPLGASPLVVGLSPLDRVYFVHSYYPEVWPDLVGATTAYGEVRFASALSRDNLHATQFHPEKSGPVGLRILANLLVAI